MSKIDTNYIEGRFIEVMNALSKNTKVGENARRISEATSIVDSKDKFLIVLHYQIAITGSPLSTEMSNHNLGTISDHQFIESCAPLFE